MCVSILSAIIALSGALIGSFITLFISKLNRKDKYLFTAIDKKLEKHQEAFKLAIDLPSAIHNSEINEGKQYITDCHIWWNKNCLYLEPNARKAFYSTVQVAYNYKDLLIGFRDKSISFEELHRKWNEIINLPKVIEKGVNKPLITFTKVKPNIDEVGQKINS